MTRLDVVRADPNGPKFSRAHSKQETVWEKQYEGNVKADLTSYPELGDEVVAWKEGMEMARAKARFVNDDYCFLLSVCSGNNFLILGSYGQNVNLNFKMIGFGISYVLLKN